MGYHVKALSSASQSPHKRALARSWKLQFIKMTEGIRRARDIPLTEYRVHGFLPTMTLEQAKRQKSFANQKLKKDESEVRKILSVERVTERERAQFHYLKEDEVREFEAQVLFRRLSRGDQSARKRNKILVHWNFVKDMLCELKADPSDWQQESHLIYNYFAHKRLSLDYSIKILRVLNVWGYFTAKKNGKAFLPVPSPRGMDRAYIVNSFQDKKKEFKKTGRKVARASAPITVDHLETNRNSFEEKQYNWLFISVWLGLRPIEIDRLDDPENYKIDFDEALGVQTLWVYQHKLITLAPDDRWKIIPCIYPEQCTALNMIFEGNFKRPLSKTVQKYLGEQFTLNGGRKNFEDMMTSRGHRLEVVAEWMGHQTIERTWRSYRKRKRVRI